MGIACLLFVGLGCGPSDQKPGGSRVKPSSPRHTTSKPGTTREAEALDLTLVPGGIHEVRPRDTLEGLAERYYGSKRHWRKIWVANRNRLEDPHMLPVGMKLIIP